MARLHSNGEYTPPVLLTNVTFDNLDRDRLLVEDKDANVIDAPTTTPLPTTLPPNTTRITPRPLQPSRPTFDVSQFVEDYDNDNAPSEGGSLLNVEINAATNLNSDLYPRYYRRAMGFTVFGESCFDPCENRDGYDYTWCHKFKESALGTWSDSDYCTSDSRTTPFGEQCIDRCAKRGHRYYWCHKETTLWGYCTPEHLIEQLEQNTISREILLLSIG